MFSYDQIELKDEYFIHLVLLAHTKLYILGKDQKTISFVLCHEY